MKKTVRADKEKKTPVQLRVFLTKDEAFTARQIFQSTDAALAHLDKYATLNILVLDGGQDLSGGVYVYGFPWHQIWHVEITPCSKERYG